MRMGTGSLLRRLNRHIQSDGRNENRGIGVERLYMAFWFWDRAIQHDFQSKSRQTYVIQFLNRQE
jgi:hypothetical protein